MSEQTTMEIRGFYRSHSHLPIWEVMKKAGIWDQYGLRVSFEFCDSSEAAEKALFADGVDERRVADLLASQLRYLLDWKLGDELIGGRVKVRSKADDGLAAFHQ